MKKSILCFFLVFCLAVGMSMTVFADSDAYVNDFASVLTEDEQIELNEIAIKTSSALRSHSFVVFVDDYTEYIDGDIEDFARYASSELDCADGDTASYTMLAVSVNNGEYCIYTADNDTIDDSDRSYLSKQFLPYFSNGEWAKGTENYLNGLVKVSSGDTQSSSDTSGGAIAIGIIISLLIAMLIAFIICYVIKQQLKSVSMAYKADEYISADGLTLTVKSDRFSHSTQEVREIKTDSKDD